MYRIFRYIVFGSFVICNAVTMTSAIWNLSLIQGGGRELSAGRRSDGFSTFLGSAGLVIIFPILFCEIANKDIFLTKVWFELIWVATFCAMGLAGAAIATAAGIDVLCQPELPALFSLWASPSTPIQPLEDPSSSPRCNSSRVLQGASWMGSLILLCYFVLLAVFTLLKNKEDGTIWQCYARKFPWTLSQTRLPSTPMSPTAGIERKTSKVSKVSLRRFLSRSSGKVPTIAAPRPRRAANDQIMREAILSYRSGLSLEYEIEHFRPTQGTVSKPRPAVTVEDKRGAPVMTVQPIHATSLSPSLYPEHMRVAMAATNPRLHTHGDGVQSEQSNSFPPPPNPVGNWPQVNPPVRRLGPRNKGGQVGAHSNVTPATESPASPTFRSRPGGPRKPSISYDTTRQRSVAFMQRTTISDPLVDSENFKV